jgi:hypothetical protein
MTKKSGTQTIAVKSDEQNPEPLELIAKSIIELSDAFKKIEEGPLAEKTIVLLLQDATGLTQRDIKAILHAAPRLKNWYVKQTKDLKK